MIEVVAIGRRIDPDLQSAVVDYEDRLRGPFKLKWRLLPYSRLKGGEARRDESQRILNAIDDGCYVILLDERGKNVSSPELASRIESVQAQGHKRIVFVVGGAYGVDDTVVGRADFTWSLSRLVFPHRIVHLILAEQVYRAQEISKGGPYHHQ